VTVVLEEAGAQWVVVRLDEGDRLPPLDELGGVVALGGPMSVHDAHAHPWLVREREWLAAAVGEEMPVLGICLGAQQLAAALGAAVRTGPGPEIGLGEVTLACDASDDPVLGPEGERVPVLHWHGDTFDIPPNAVRLAGSDRYENQAFRYGRNAYGFQFHVEVDRPLADAWARFLPVGTTVDEPRRAEVEGVGRRILGRIACISGIAAEPELGQ
jgi:GMP synthase-like glutamine amidotransferase